MAHDIFDHDHRAIDHHAEIERAQRQQIGRNIFQAQADRSEEQREGNGQGDDERAAQIAEEQKQNHGNENYSFGEVVQHGVSGEAHQIAAIQERNYFYAGRQDVIVQFFDLGVNSGQRFVGIGAFAQEHDAFHHIGIVNNHAVGAVNGFADLAQADFGALHHRRNIPDGQRRAVFGGEHGLLDVLDVVEQAHRADVDLLQAGLDEAAAGVGVVGSELLLDLGEAEAVSDELLGIDLHLILAGGAAKAGNIDHVGDGFKLFFELPIFDGFQFHQVVLGVGAAQGVPEDLADRAPVGAHLRLQIVGQRDLRQTFQDFCAVPVVGGLIVENEHHAGEAKERIGTEMLQVRKPVHLDFDGNGDLLFHFFGGAARPLGDDLNVIVGDVGVGFDRKIVKRNRAPNEQQHGESQNQETVIECVVHEGANHCGSNSLFARMAASRSHPSQVK